MSLRYSSDQIVEGFALCRIACFLQPFRFPFPIGPFLMMNQQLSLVLLGLFLNCVCIYSAQQKDSSGKQRRLVSGGKPVPIGKYPFFSASDRVELSAGFFGGMCGGALIHPRLVLTAAVCVPSLLFDDLRIGYDRRSDPQTGLPVRLDSTRAHPRHFCSSVSNIALILLSEPISNVTLVPYVRNDATIPLEDAVLTTMGFGGRFPDDELGTNVLHEVNVTVLNNDDMLAKYGPSNYDPPVFNASFMFGATAVGGGGPCDYDTGGPVLDAETGILVGSISSVGCDESESLFTRIGAYTDWIDAVICEVETGKNATECGIDYDEFCPPIPPPEEQCGIFGFFFPKC